GRLVPAAHDRQRSRPGAVRPPAGRAGRAPRRRRDPLLGLGGGRGGALARAGRGGRADPRAHARDRHARGPVLLADRGPPARARARARAPARRGSSMKPSAATVYRWELRKLRSQKRTYLGLGAAVAVPIIFVVATSLQGGGPNDVAF